MLSQDRRTVAPGGPGDQRQRVERIWRREGLKVPGKQPRRGRLWLADGPCIRLRPQHRDHVWSYDFVEDRTHDGRMRKHHRIEQHAQMWCFAHDHYDLFEQRFGSGFARGKPRPLSKPRIWLSTSRRRSTSLAHAASSECVYRLSGYFSDRSDRQLFQQPLPLFGKTPWG